MLRAGRGCRAQGEGTAGQPNLPCLWVITFILTPVRLNRVSADLIFTLSSRTQEKVRGPSLLVALDTQPTPASRQT